jgi:hypothetical protein
MNALWIILAVIGALILIGAICMAPEIARYLKIRKM